VTAGRGREIPGAGRLRAATSRDGALDAADNADAARAGTGPTRHNGAGYANVGADRTSQQAPRSRPADGGFGEPLRRAREACGTTLEEVAEKTRIAPHHLNALEQSDLDALPAGPFGKSYIRSYAEVLGIDPAPILDAYHVQEIRRGVGAPERDQQMLQELSHLVGRGEDHGGLLGLRVRTAVVAAAAVLVAILGTVGWLLARSGAPRTPAPAPRAASATPSPAPVSPPESTPPSRADRLTRSPGGVVAPARPQPAQRAASPAVGAGAQQEKPPPAKLPTDTLQVSDFGVGTEVVDRRLVGKAEEFPEGTRVSFWTLVVGGQPGHVVRHVWFQAGRAVMRADLRVGGPHWRTRSSLVLPAGSSGPWTVEARTIDGRLLARNDFVCERRSR
jgi:cytoskeletal protein RodZ